MTKSRNLRRSWTEDEIIFLKDNPTMKIVDICSALNRVKSSVDKKRNNLGISSDFHTPWTEDEKNTVSSNPLMGNIELGLLLNRSSSSVGSHRFQYSLKTETKCILCDNNFSSDSGREKICGNCSVEIGDTKSVKGSTFLMRYGTYKDGANRRNLEFNISFKEFKTFWKMPCTYCGSEIDTIGLDRIDSDKDYSISNVAACCHRCNEMKMSETKEDWIKQMKQILTHLGEI